MPFRLPLALAATLALTAGCGNIVAPDAPVLLTQEQIASRTAGTQDTTRGIREASALALRAARLRARAAQLRRASRADAERLRLLRRAEELKQR